ncbi:MAG: DNA internalization-related competence protein ComEC/Rec2 [Pirellulales bacterium]
MLLEPSEPEDRMPGVYYAPLVLVACGLVVGVMFDRFLPLPISVWLFAAFTLFGLWSFCWWIKHRRLASCLLLTAVVCSGGYAHHKHWNLFHADEIALAADDHAHPMAMKVVLLDVPRSIPAAPYDPFRIIPSTDSVRVPVRLTQIRNGRTWQSASGQGLVILNAEKFAANIGDTVELFGQISRSASPLNPGEYDFASNARAERSMCLIRAGFPECAKRIEQGSSWDVFTWMKRIRHQTSVLLESTISEESRPLAYALMLGRRERLARSLTEEFMQSGTIHLLAISGLHLGVLALFVYGVMRVLLVPSWVPPVMTILFTLLYVGVVDARAPIIRASVLIFVFCLGQILVRRPSSWNSLAAALIVVVLMNPADVFRTGNQLSFLAVGVLIWFAPYLMSHKQTDKLKRHIKATRSWPVKLLRESRRFVYRMFLAGLLVWLAALPLVMYKFHLVSPSAVVLSPLLMIPVGLALISGLLATICSLVFTPAADFFGAFTSSNLEIMQSTVATVNGLPVSHAWVAGPAAWWVIGFYGLLFVLAVSVQLRRLSSKWAVTVLAVWIATGFVTDWTQAEISKHQNQLSCTFIAVGHGTSVLLEFPDGRNMLYDCGRLGSPTRAADSVAAVLWNRGISHLDAIVLSHADVDHYNGVPRLLERFSVGRVYHSPVMFEKEAAALTALKDAIANAGVQSKVIFAGDRLSGGDGVQIEVLHPGQRGGLGSDNANSIVLAIEYQGHNILLPGDLESPGTEALLAEEPIEFDIVMAPHHGSAGSNPAGFVQWAQPKWVVVSSGHSTEELQAIEALESTGGSTLTTSAVGAIRFELSNTGVLVSSIRRAEKDK